MPIRPATLDDIPVLLELEAASFRTDRLTRRNFRHLISQGHASTLVFVGDADDVRGYILMLFHAGTSLARMYSLAVSANHRGQGIAKALIQAAEAIAVANEAAFVRLEVRYDDPVAHGLYVKLGYREFGRHPGYYEDGTDAIRMEKSLAPILDPAIAKVPYYAQTLPFTCGPSALMMAMHTLQPERQILDRTAELQLWRESTTIFMTAGHGGCGPYGLALAAWNRGYDVDLHVSGVDAGAFFADSVRGDMKKEVVRLVQAEFRAEVAKTGIRVHTDPFTVADMQSAFEAGGIPVVLVSAYRFSREKQPHWVVVSGFSANYVYLNDPDLDLDEHQVLTDRMNVPVSRDDFDRAARYGRARHRAAIIIRRRATRAGNGQKAR